MALEHHGMDQATLHPPLKSSNTVAISLALAAGAVTLAGAYYGFALVLVAIVAVAVLFALRKAGPAGQVGFLMAAIQLNIFSIEFGDRVFNYETFFALRPATPAASILLVLLAWRLLNGTETLGKIPAIKPMLALDAAYFISTLLHFHSPFFFRGLMVCGLLTLNIGVFVLFVRQLLPRRELIERAVRWLIALYAMYALAGILMVFANMIGLDPHDNLVEVEALGDWTLGGSNTPIPRPWSFDTDTGSQMTAVCLLAMAKAMQRDERRRHWLWLCAALIFIGVLMSFSRGAWVGLGAGLILLPFSARFAPQVEQKLRTPIWRTAAILAGTVVGGYFLIVAVLPYLKDVLIDRLMTLTMWDQGTMFHRYETWILLISDALQSPVWGRGAAAFRGLLEPPFIPESFLIETFHSSGLVGAGAYLWIQIYMLRRAMRLLRAGQHLQLRWIMPFLVSYAGYFLSIQTNPDAWGAFYWMFLALFVATLCQGTGDRVARTIPAITN